MDSPAARHAAKWEVKDVRRIWDAAPHCAFTTLIHFRGCWLCAFREAESHVSHDGRIRIIRSSDGMRWESAAVLPPRSAGDDLRDPKFAITPGGELMLSAGLLNRQAVPPKRRSVVWFSGDGMTWKKMTPDSPSGDTWRWQITWHAGQAYSIGYGGRDSGGCLYRSPDGIGWEPLIRPFFPANSRNESSQWIATESCLAFGREGDAFCVVRRDPLQPDDQPGPSAWVARSAPPYEHWTWRELGQRVGGPLLVQLADGRWILAGRTYGPRSTALLEIDPLAPHVLQTLVLPSGGDTSYAGVVEDDGLLWISYYSSHEGKTAVYLARVHVPPVA